MPSTSTHAVGSRGGRRVRPRAVQPRAIEKTDALRPEVSGKGASSPPGGSTRPDPTRSTDKDVDWLLAARFDDVDELVDASPIGTYAEAPDGEAGTGFAYNHPVEETLLLSCMERSAKEALQQAREDLVQDEGSGTLTAQYRRGRRERLWQHDDWNEEAPTAATGGSGNDAFIGLCHEDDGDTECMTILRSLEQVKLRLQRRRTPSATAGCAAEASSHYASPQSGSADLTATPNSSSSDAVSLLWATSSPVRDYAPEKVDRRPAVRFDAAHYAECLFRDEGNADDEWSGDEGDSLVSAALQDGNGGSTALTAFLRRCLPVRDLFPPSSDTLLASQYGMDYQQISQLLEYSISSGNPQVQAWLRAKQLGASGALPTAIPAEGEAVRSTASPTSIDRGRYVPAVGTSGRDSFDTQAVIDGILQALPPIPADLQSELARQRRLLEHLTKVQQDCLHRASQAEEAASRRRLQAPRVDPTLGPSAVALSPGSVRTGLHGQCEPYAFAKVLQQVAGDPTQPLPPLINITTAPATAVTEKENRYVQRELQLAREEHRESLRHEQQDRKKEHAALMHMMHQQRAALTQQQKETLTQLHQDARMQQHKQAELLQQLTNAQEARFTRHAGAQERQQAVSIRQAVSAALREAPPVVVLPSPRLMSSAGQPAGGRRARSKPLRQPSHALGRGSKRQSSSPPPAHRPHTASSVIAPHPSVPIAATDESIAPPASPTTPDDATIDRVPSTAPDTALPSQAAHRGRRVRGPFVVRLPEEELGAVADGSPLSGRSPYAATGKVSTSQIKHLCSSGKKTPQRAQHLSGPSATVRPKRPLPMGAAVRGALFPHKSARRLSARDMRQSNSGASPIEISASPMQFVCEEVCSLSSANGDSVMSKRSYDKDGRSLSIPYLGGQSISEVTRPKDISDNMSAATVAGKPAVGRTMLLLTPPAKAEPNCVEAKDSSHARGSDVANATSGYACDIGYLGAGTEGGYGRHWRELEAAAAEVRRRQKSIHHELSSAGAYPQTDILVYSHEPRFAEGGTDPAGDAYDATELMRPTIDDVLVETKHPSTITPAVAAEAAALRDARRRLHQLQHLVLPQSADRNDRAIATPRRMTLSMAPELSRGSSATLADLIFSETICSILGESSEAAVLSDVMRTLKQDMLRGVLRQEVIQRHLPTDTTESTKHSALDGVTDDASTAVQGDAETLYATSPRAGGIASQDTCQSTLMHRLEEAMLEAFCRPDGDTKLGVTTSDREVPTLPSVLSHDVLCRVLEQVLLGEGRGASVTVADGTATHITVPACEMVDWPLELHGVASSVRPLPEGAAAFPLGTGKVLTEAGSTAPMEKPLDPDHTASSGAVVLAVDGAKDEATASGCGAVASLPHTGGDTVLRVVLDASSFMAQLQQQLLPSLPIPRPAARETIMEEPPRRADLDEDLDDVIVEEVRVPPRRVPSGWSAALLPAEHAAQHVRGRRDSGEEGSLPLHLPEPTPVVSLLLPPFPVASLLSDTSRPQPTPVFPLPPTPPPLTEGMVHVLSRPSSAPPVDITVANVPHVPSSVSLVYFMDMLTAQEGQQRWGLEEQEKLQRHAVAMLWECHRSVMAYDSAMAEAIPTSKEPVVDAAVGTLEESPPLPSAENIPTSSAGDRERPMRDPVTRFIFEWLQVFGEREALATQRRTVVEGLAAAQQAAATHHDVATSLSRSPSLVPGDRLQHPSSFTSSSPPTTTSPLSSTNPSSHETGGGHRFAYSARTQRLTHPGLPLRYRRAMPLRDAGGDKTSRGTSATTRYTTTSASTSSPLSSHSLEGGPLHPGDYSLPAATMPTTNLAIGISGDRSCDGRAREAQRFAPPPPLPQPIRTFNTGLPFVAPGSGTAPSPLAPVAPSVYPFGQRNIPHDEESLRQGLHQLAAHQRQQRAAQLEAEASMSFEGAYLRHLVGPPVVAAPAATGKRPPHTLTQRVTDPVRGRGVAYQCMARAYTDPARYIFEETSSSCSSDGSAASHLEHDGARAILRLLKGPADPHMRHGHRLGENPSLHDDGRHAAQTIGPFSSGGAGTACIDVLGARVGGPPVMGGGTYGNTASPLQMESLFVPEADVPSTPKRRASPSAEMRTTENTLIEGGPGEDAAAARAGIPPLRSCLLYGQRSGVLVGHDLYAALLENQKEEELRHRAAMEMNEARERRQARYTGLHDRSTTGGVTRRHAGDISYFRPYPRAYRYRRDLLATLRFLYRLNVNVAALACGMAIFVLILVHLPFVGIHNMAVQHPTRIPLGAVSDDPRADFVPDLENNNTMQTLRQDQSFGLAVSAVQSFDAPMFLFLSLLLLVTHAAPVACGIADAWWRHDRHAKPRAETPLSSVADVRAGHTRGFKGVGFMWKSVMRKQAKGSRDRIQGAGDVEPGMGAQGTDATDHTTYPSALTSGTTNGVPKRRGNCRQTIYSRGYDMDVCASRQMTRAAFDQHRQQHQHLESRGDRRSPLNGQVGTRGSGGTFGLLSSISTESNGHLSITPHSGLPELGGVWTPLNGLGSILPTSGMSPPLRVPEAGVSFSCSSGEGGMPTHDSDEATDWRIGASRQRDWAGTTTTRFVGASSRSGERPLSTTASTTGVMANGVAGRLSAVKRRSRLRARPGRPPVNVVDALLQVRLWCFLLCLALSVAELCLLSDMPAISLIMMGEPQPMPSGASDAEALRVVTTPYASRSFKMALEAIFALRVGGLLIVCFFDFVL